MVFSTSLVVILLMVIVELGLLIVMRRFLAHQVMSVSRLFSDDAQKGIWIYSILTLPGILAHEVAHFLVAALLGLRTGPIEMLPHVANDGSVELGSVAVVASDPLRQSFVGMAPFLFGLPLVVWLSSLLPPPTFPYHGSWITVLVFYLIASISLHIFPSRRDMAAWPVIGILTIISCYALIRYGVVSPLMNQLVLGLGISVLSSTGLIIIIGIIHQVGRKFVSVQ